MKLPRVVPVDRPIVYLHLCRGASPPGVLCDSQGCQHPLRDSGCRVTPQQILISSLTTLSPRLAVPLFSLFVPRIISEDDGAPRAEAVQQAERTPHCPRGGSTLRRPPDVSRRNRLTPRRRLGAIVGSFATGTAGPG